MKESEFIYSEKVSFIEHATKQVKAFALFTKQHFYIFPTSSVASFMVVKVKNKYAYTSDYMKKVVQLAKELSEEDFYTKMKKILPENRIINVRYLIEFNVFSRWYASGIGFQTQNDDHRVIGVRPRATGKKLVAFYHK